MQADGLGNASRIANAGAVLAIGGRVPGGIAGSGGESDQRQRGTEKSSEVQASSPILVLHTPAILSP